MLARTVKFIDTWLYDHDPILACEIRQVFGYHYQPPSPIGTQQSWYDEIKRYRCYLCKPARLGFHSLDSLNEHLTSHWERHYKCPHSACNLPFNTIAGLIQHIESRICRCMTDSNWWCSYILLIDTDALGRRVEEPSLWAGLTPVDIMNLSDYWVEIYDEMTGSGGHWESKRRRMGDWVIDVGLLILKFALARLESFRFRVFLLLICIVVYQLV